MKIFVDLDHTLCFPDESYGHSRDKYRFASPNEAMIEMVNRWFAAGHEIVIYTARRMKTHDGNLEKIEEDVGEITRQWLTDHFVSHTKLMFGKPYYDILIDDKTCLPDIPLIQNTILSGKLPPV